MILHTLTIWFSRIYSFKYQKWKVKDIKTTNKKSVPLWYSFLLSVFDFNWSFIFMSNHYTRWFLRHRYFSLNSCIDSPYMYIPQFKNIFVFSEYKWYRLNIWQLSSRIYLLSNPTRYYRSIGLDRNKIMFYFCYKIISEEF